MACADWQADMLANNRFGETDLVYRDGAVYLFVSVDVPETECNQARNGFLGVERSGGDAGEAYALVVLNTNGRHTSKTRLVTSKPAGTLLADALTPGPAYTVGAGGVLEVELPAQSAIVLVPR